jgi:hypothetical protein
VVALLAVGRNANCATSGKARHGKAWSGNPLGHPGGFFVLTHRVFGGMQDLMVGESPGELPCVLERARGPALRESWRWKARRSSRSENRGRNEKCSVMKAIYLLTART